MPGKDGQLRRQDWEVRTLSLQRAQELVMLYHYSHGGSNTAVYRHGLFPVGSLFDADAVGVAWWLPPTKAAALATYPKNWQGVLSLTRLVIAPDVPGNAASFLLGRSMRMIDRNTWPCLVTYADEAQGHTGAIYRATNWTYVGKTAPSPRWVRDGRLVARKSASHTRTNAEMEALGCEMVGMSAKHKFVHIVEQQKT